MTFNRHPFLPIFLSILGIFVSALETRAQAEVTLGVDSPGARFSPGNWAGDEGRAGKVYRRTWNNGAWCEFRWTTPAEQPTAKLLIANQTGGSSITEGIGAGGSLGDYAFLVGQGLRGRGIDTGVSACG